jgi:hypothetical protein
VLRYDSDERHFARSVPPVPVAERLPPGRPAVYGRAARDGRGRRWLQYWLFFAQNAQDRGIVRTGRHAGVESPQSGVPAGALDRPGRLP